jgi:DNA sulfur modification protein DndB
LSEVELKPTTAQEDFLAPLLSDKKLQTAEYRVRNRPFISQSVPQGEVPEFLENGWEIQRAGKRKTNMRRPKSNDQLLEDRVWCLLYKMGYDRLNGKRFIIQFDRDDGSRGRKQVDVFASDPETAFVIECKARENRGRRSLLRDLLETVALQTYIRKSIYSAYGNTPKPKIIWAYATQNIIWSEPDVARANDGSISILTENELQYLDKPQTWH